MPSLDPLKMATSDVQIDLIWGNDDETQTFAHAHDEKGTALTFRFSRGARLQSLASRIVACFHELTVMFGGETFPERSMMRMALGNAARQAWPNCVYAAAASDAVVDLDGDAESQIDWCVRYEPVLYWQ